MPKPFQIFLVDDDPEDQQILEEYLLLINRNISFWRAGDGREAIELLDTDKFLKPDLMIFDYKMPLMGAIDILKYLNDRPSFNKTPKVVWSTSAQPLHQQICMDQGAVAYFVKPDSPSGMTTLARDLLEIIISSQSNGKNT